MVELVESGLEDLDAGGDGLERPVDLGWSGDGGGGTVESSMIRRGEASFDE
jgi:hypothetical protein